MSDWSNEESILRDLAIAQGGVPVGDVNVVSSKDKPPAVHIVEETEEQFFQQYAVDASTNTAPDLNLIQEMLHLVRDVRVNEIEDLEAVKVEESNKISHESEKEEDCKTRSPLRIPKKTVNVNNKQNRNNVVESMIDLNENQKSKDLSHTDIKMTKEKIDNGVIPFVVSPVNMFKHKSKKCVENASASSNNINENSPATQHKPGVYVPSSQAQAYYDRLMENKKQKELREETIWTRAERQMKEIEAKRRKEKEMALAHN